MRRRTRMLSVGLLGTAGLLDLGSPCGIPQSPARFRNLSDTRKKRFGPRVKI
jgi:hypothetical protein